MNRTPPALALVIAAVLLAGCVSSGGAAAPAPGSRLDDVNAAILRGARSAGAPGADAAYVIEPPDVIAIDVRGEPDLSVSALPVGPDGRVHRPLVGSVDVAGRSAAELAADLRRRYERYIRGVEVSVAVVEHRSKHVYVTGEVRRPGRYAYTGGDRVLDVLAQAGFLTRNANSDAIRVARARDGYTESLPVHLEDIVRIGDPRTNWRLRPDDVIEVPPGLLARVAYAFHDLLAPVAVPVRVHTDD